VRTDAGRARRTGPRELSVTVTTRYRIAWGVVRLICRLLFDLRARDTDRLPPAPYLLACNHHNGADPLLVMAALPLEPRITWFGPREADFSRGFKNRLMAFVGGVIPYHPEMTTLTSAVRAVRRVFAAGGVLGIFAEGRIGFRESELLQLEEGAVAFAVTAQVPIVPCAILGSTRLWFRRRIVIAFGEPIPTVGLHGHRARAELEQQLHAAVVALLPKGERTLPNVRPMSFLTDLLNGADDVARRRREEGS
jgi:1-acyl-sn-glycerol-3-phosphate acyltransferase